MIIITLITSMIVIIIVIILPQSKRERAQITFLTALYGTAKAESEVINVPTLPIHKVGIRSVVALKQFVHFLEPFTFEGGEDLLL